MPLPFKRSDAARQELDRRLRGGDRAEAEPRGRYHPPAGTSFHIRRSFDELSGTAPSRCW
jgi:hypothetical protein